MGNLTSLTYPGGKQVGYQYDATNRLTTVTDWAGRVTSYQYDANGRLLKTTRPDGTEQTNTYDAAGQLLQQKDVDVTGNVIAQYDYTYDGAGNVTKELSPVPTQTFNLTGVAMTYTTDNRLDTYNGQPVEYDLDGNMTKGPLGGAMANYAYDCRNRLTSAGITSYQYDAENNRISVANSVNGGRFDYIINPNAYLSQVLISTDEKGSQTFYVYGLGLIGQETGGVYHTYHYDRRGSTVALTDVSGNVTDRFQYEPYGTLTHRTGDTRTQFQYNGRFGVMTDANGLYHMRARYYNPEIKRFINRDILPGSITDSRSLNSYAYANGCPVSLIDPFGLSPDGDNRFAEGASLAADFVPGVSNIKSFIQVFTGKDLITGREESRLWSAVGAVPGLGNLSKVRKLSKAEKLAEETLTAICFTEETPVYTKEGYKRIKDAQAGDEVYSENTETGEKGLKKVKNVFVSETDTLIHVTAGNQEIKSTTSHPYWVKGKGWVRAEDLQPGDKLQLYSNELVEVEAVEKKLPGKPVKVYNFEVEDWHTYFVSESNILVHNRCWAEGAGKAGKVTPDFIVSPGGTVIPVPKGSVGPGPVNTGKGFSYLDGSGGSGLNDRVTGVRIMDSTSRYPNGYTVYMNKNGQTVNPYTGQTTLGKSDPWGHIPLD